MLQAPLSLVPMGRKVLKSFLTACVHWYPNVLLLLLHGKLDGLFIISYQATPGLSNFTETISATH